MDIGKIVLIYPKRDGRVLGKAPGAPYTLMRLASLVPDDIPVEIWDENLGPLNYESLGPRDLVGITSMTLTIERAQAIAAEARKRCGAVVVGGAHATLLPEEVMTWADSTVVGEAYFTWPQIIKDFAGNTLKPIYQNDGWASLDGIAPITDRVISMVDEKRDYWTPYLEITRGCPRNCSFCTAIHVSGRVMRLRPIDEVVDEIQRRGIRRFFLTDDNFGLNFRTDPEYCEELFRALAKLPLKGWTCQAESIVGLHPDLLKLAYEAHLDKFFIGFESVNPGNRSNLGGKSRGKTEEHKEVIRNIHAAGIGVVGLFVSGFDDDTFATFEATWQFIKESELDSVSITALTPFPLTPLRQQLIEEDRLLPAPWSHYDTAHVTFEPKRMSAEEFRQAYDWICRRAYSPVAIAKRGLRSWRRYPLNMAQRKLFGSFSTDYGYRRTYAYRHAV